MKMNNRYLCMRYTDKSGYTCVVEHRVFDSKRFISSRKYLAEKEGGKACAEEITKLEYSKEK